MSSPRKPIREMDSILVRMPDEIKERIAQRALANGRSLAAEALAMLQNALDIPAGADPHDLVKEAEKIMRNLDTFQAQVRHNEERLAAINEELRSIYPGGQGDFEPLTHAMREYWRYRDDLRQKKADQRQTLYEAYGHIPNKRLVDLILDNPELSKDDIQSLVDRENGRGA